MARASPAAMTRWPRLLAAIEPSKGSVMNRWKRASYSKRPLRGGQEMTAGQPVGSQFHAAMLRMISNQMLACEPPETGEMIGRLAAVGYEWPSIMHMVAALISDDIRRAMNQDRLLNPGYRCRECPARAGQ